MSVSPGHRLLPSGDPMTSGDYSITRAAASRLGDEVCHRTESSVAWRPVECYFFLGGLWPGGGLSPFVLGSKGSLCVCVCVCVCRLRSVPENSIDHLDDLVLMKH